MPMKIIVTYWNPCNKTVRTESGFCYLDTTSVITETQEHEVNNQEEKEALFKEIYARNRQLRYCNGSYWKFVDKEIDQEYRKFLQTYVTISVYYGGGVVD